VKDIRQAGLRGKIGKRLLAVITDTPQGKRYRAVEASDLVAVAKASKLASSIDRPTEIIVPEINGPTASPNAGAHRSISVDIYGYKTFGSLIDDRPLVVLSAFTTAYLDVVDDVQKSATDHTYTDAVLTYLALWISWIAQRSTNIGRLHSTRETYEQPFGQMAIPMVWDYAEANPFAESTGGATGGADWIVRVIERESGFTKGLPAIIILGDAAAISLPPATVDAVVTDPPYFDAVSYADLSDFFYVWLKRTLGTIQANPFATPQTPKTEEAVANKHRHDGNRSAGTDFYQRKLAACFLEARRLCKPDGVISVIFAHQTTEAWTALINALLAANLNITATFPIDTELKNRSRGMDVSALESSITVVCRPRAVSTSISFKDVRREIERVVKDSVKRFWDYGFRGADLIVACYGPAVGVFGKYERVEKGDGTPVSVPTLLEQVRESALKAIAGEFTGDVLSRLYFVWANLYGTSEQAWDDARMVVQIGAATEDALEVARGRGLLVVDGSKCRLALLRDRSSRRHLGDDDDAPLIDQVHHAMQQWKDEDRSGLVKYLRDHELADHVPFWKLAQALFEVLPHNEEDWKLVSALLGERETLRLETRKPEQPAPSGQRGLFDEET
jgi:putative DNA methylase